jgi:hypothetical protein
MTPRHAQAARLRERLEDRLRRSPSESVYPVADWQIAERRFTPEHLGSLESVFAVANGYLGIRGTPEEGAPAHDAAVMLNGFYESWPIVYPEDAYGLARTGQTIVNATDGSIIRLFSTTSRSTWPPQGSSAWSGCSTCSSGCSAARSSGRPCAVIGC